MRRVRSDVPGSDCNHGESARLAATQDGDCPICLKEAIFGVAGWQRFADNLIRARDDALEDLETAQGDIETLKKRIRELEEKRNYDCAELGCDRLESLEEGSGFWKKE